MVRHQQQISTQGLGLSLNQRSLLLSLDVTRQQSHSPRTGAPGNTQDKALSDMRSRCARSPAVG